MVYLPGSDGRGACLVRKFPFFRDSMRSSTIAARGDQANVVLLWVAGEHRREDPLDQRLEAVADRGAGGVSQSLDPDCEALSLPLDQSVGVEDQRVAGPDAVALLGTRAQVDPE